MKSAYQYSRYDLTAVDVDLQHLAQVVARLLCCLCVAFILSWFTTRQWEYVQQILSSMFSSP